MSFQIFRNRYYMHWEVKINKGEVVGGVVNPAGHIYYVTHVIYFVPLPPHAY